MRDQREKTVKAILDELDDLTYKKGVNYVEKAQQLPQIDSKESRLSDIAACFHNRECLLTSIRNASDKIVKTSLGAISYHSAVVNNIIEAFNQHQKMCNELNGTTRPAVPQPKGKAETKAQPMLSREGSQHSISVAGSNHDSRLPLIKSLSKLPPVQREDDSRDESRKWGLMSVCGCR